MIASGTASLTREQGVCTACGGTCNHGFGISTSGNSKNVIEALNYAKANGIITVGLTGEKGGIMKELCDYCICMPSNETPRVQEGHILVGHIICAVVEEAIFGKGF